MRTFSARQPELAHMASSFSVAPPNAQGLPLVEAKAERGAGTLTAATLRAFLGLRDN